MEVPNMKVRISQGDVAFEKIRMRVEGARLASEVLGV
jgi:hypothetical protein